LLLVLCSTILLISRESCAPKLKAKAGNILNNLSPCGA
jgi:hypothetical protein